MHFLAGWIALGSGLANLLGAKGTAGHRALGLLFALSMCLVAVDAVARIADGDVDVFVALALLSCAATIWALLPFVGRRPGWVERHAYRMQGAYIALGAAAGNEIVSTEMARWTPDAPRWPLSVAVILLVATIGWWLARRQRTEIRRVAGAWP